MTPTTVTVKGQITLPKAVREAAGIRPGDRVTVRATPRGEVIIEREPKEPTKAALAEAKKRIDKAVAYARRHRIDNGMRTDEIMELLRGDD
ncbi:MAG: AbrB/MazE/SpoVT family DNA-binding domain-containing protein [Beijerinckiaceae bacterium]